GVELDLTDGPGIPEQHTESLHHRQGCEIVMLGTGYVEFTLDLAQWGVGAFLIVADEPGAVKRGGGGDPRGIACRRGQCIGAAHAIAVAAHWPSLDLALPIGEGEHRSNIMHHRWNGHLGAYGSHALALRTVLIEHARSI